MNVVGRLPFGAGRWLVAALVLVGACAVQAQTSDEIDPPGRVGRIADTFGQAWLYSPDTGDWIAAVRNRPITTGDHFATDPGARAELTVGSTTVRVDGGTEVEVVRLDDQAVVLHLHSGAMALRVRDARAVGELELTTPEGRMRVQAAGRYRIDRGDRATELTVLQGQAQWEGPGNGLTLYPGQRGQFWIESNGVAQYAITDPLRDAFAAWDADRDRALDRAPVARYVSPEMTGAQDLDRYGRWEQSPDYGAIWYPAAVPVGWAPYTAGHWAWVRPWGWTWVDDAPWGFAPFHYGRWVHYRGRWCWSPGRYVARPVYAPALVAWIGGSHGGVSVTVGGGPAVGWVPLAPHEVYVPAFRAAPRYVREVNVTHVTNVTNITTIINRPPREYANWRAPHAVTVVPASVIERREPVGPQAARARELPAVRAFVQAPPPRPVAAMTPPVPVPAPVQRPDARAPAPPGFAARTERGADDRRRTIPERPRPSPPAEARGPTAAPAPAGPVARPAPMAPAATPVPAPTPAPVAPSRATPPPSPPAVRPAQAPTVRPAEAPVVRPAQAPVVRPAEAPPPARAAEPGLAPPAGDGRRTIPRPPSGEDRAGRERREALPVRPVEPARPPAPIVPAHAPPTPHAPAPAAVAPATAAPAAPPPHARPPEAARPVAPARAPEALRPAPPEARPPEARGAHPEGRGARPEPREERDRPNQTR